jgi:hypothetical protein
MAPLVTAVTRIVDDGAPVAATLLQQLETDLGLQAA